MSPPGPASPPHALRPPAAGARRVAVALSVVAVLVSLGCGFAARRAFALRNEEPEILMKAVLAFLVLLLVALLLRMGAAICELLWLERTWSNLPPDLRNVGPVKNVTSAMAVIMSFVPGVAWVWKLGLVVGVADGLEAVRRVTPFHAQVPRRIGVAAVIVGWVPGLNVYVAPFLWEMFATRLDTCIEQIICQGALRLPSAAPTPSSSPT